MIGRCRLLAVGSLLVATAHAASAAEGMATFPQEVKALCHRYVAEFGSERTELVYHHRLDGPLGDRSLSSPAEIAKGTVDGKPMPYGYGSGIQDVALENGQFLFALCDVFDATHDSGNRRAGTANFPRDPTCCHGFSGAGFRSTRPAHGRKKLLS